MATTTQSDPTPDTTPPTAPDGTPYDLDFHFDPVCPFAWQTSRWITRVVELEGIAVRWRFISLRMVNEDRLDTYSDAYKCAHERSHRYLRVLASVRDAVGEEPIAGLYTAWGEGRWYSAPEDVPPGDDSTIAGILAAAGIDPSHLEAADDERWDKVIRAETDEALARTGPDVGTPILTYWPHGTALFGPVISTVPDDETSLEMYRAVRTLVDYPGFAEVKRTNRPPLDLPALAG